VFWGTTPLGPVKVNRHHPKGRKGSRYEDDSKQNSSFLLGLHLDPEDGGHMLLRNILLLSHDYTRCIPENITPQKLNSVYSKIPLKILNVMHNYFVV
jgi:hypothetical protein